MVHLKPSPINDHIKCKGSKISIIREIFRLKKQGPTICYLQEIRFKYKDTKKSKVKKWKKKDNANSISRNFIIRLNRFQCKEYYQRQKGWFYNDKVVNFWRAYNNFKGFYILDDKISKHIQAKSGRTAKEIDKSKIITVNFNTPIPIIGRTSR